LRYAEVEGVNGSTHNRIAKFPELLLYETSIFAARNRSYVLNIFKQDKLWLYGLDHAHILPKKTVAGIVVELLAIAERKALTRGASSNNLYFGAVKDLSNRLV
jgi:hypothetical protein